MGEKKLAFSSFPVFKVAFIWNNNRRYQKKLKVAAAARAQQYKSVTGYYKIIAGIPGNKPWFFFFFKGRSPCMYLPTALKLNALLWSETCCQTGCALSTNAFGKSGALSLVSEHVTTDHVPTVTLLCRYCACRPLYHWKTIPAVWATVVPAMD